MCWTTVSEALECWNFCSNVVMITRHLSTRCQSAEYRLMLVNLSTMLPLEKPSVSVLFCFFFKQSQENIVYTGVIGHPKSLGPQMK